MLMPGESVNDPDIEALPHVGDVNELASSAIAEGSVIENPRLPTNRQGGELKMNAIFDNVTRIELIGEPVVELSLIGHEPLVAIRSITLIPPRQFVKTVPVTAPIVPPTTPDVAIEPMRLTSQMTVAMTDLMVTLPLEVAVIAPPGEIV